MGRSRKKKQQVQRSRDRSELGVFEEEKKGPRYERQGSKVGGEIPANLLGHGADTGFYSRCGKQEAV